MGVSSSQWSAGLPPTSCVTGLDFRFGHAGTGEDPEVLGDVHPIFSRNSIVKDPRGLAVGGSWNVRPSRSHGAIVTVPDQLIRRLLVEKQVSRRVPHGYRIVLRFFPLR